MRNIWILLLLCLGTFLVRATPLQAQSSPAEPQLNLETTLTLTKTTATTVKHRITLTNSTPTEYITQYGLKISLPKLQDLEVLYNQQPIQAEVVNTDTHTSIGITFPDVVVGEGKQRIVDISYQTPLLSSHLNKVLEVQIPRLVNHQDYSNHQITINTPLEYGLPSQASIPHASELLPDQVTTTLNLSEDRGVRVLYGQQQAYSINLQHQLTNATNAQKTQQLVLPPDTTYQRVHYRQLTPLPTTLLRDPDGNWIATYQLPANTTQKINLEADITTFLNPQTTVPVAKVTAGHTRSQPFWDSHSSALRELAKQYHDPGTIQSFITTQTDVESLFTPNLPRQGAKTALAPDHRATCEAMADIFVGLTRAARIPSRRIIGYAFTPDTTLKPSCWTDPPYHAWAEWFDTADQIWKLSDPAWEHMTGGVPYLTQPDLAHITFAINGLNSTTPLPPGLGEDPHQQFQHLEVNLASSQPPPQPRFSFTVTHRTLFGVPLLGLKQLVIKNETGYAWYNYTIKGINRSASDDLEHIDFLIPHLLPYQEQQFDIPIYADSWFGTSQSSLQLQYEDQELNVTIEAAPAILRWLTNPVIIGGLVISGILGSLITGSILVLRR